jgi:tellurite resistance protein TerC
MVTWIPSVAELLAAAPIILSLIAIEGLLSVDNVLIIAARVKSLDEKDRLRARKIAMIGAYGFRVLCLAFASILIQYDWIKLFGGGYLIYLMCEHLGVGESGEISQEQQAQTQAVTFGGVVTSLLLADMAFSIDNVVAAVALSPKLWVVVLGVSLGMISMFFVAGVFSKLVDRFPILEKLAYLLVGYVGLQIFAEYFFHIHVTELQKFGVIASILVGGIIYDKAKFLHPFVGPVLRWIGEIMDDLAELVNTLVKPLLALGSLVKSVCLKLVALFRR